MCEPVFENEENQLRNHLCMQIFIKSSAECILQVQTVDSHLISELYGEKGSNIR